MAVPLKILDYGLILHLVAMCSLTLIKCVSLDVPVHVRLPSLKTLSLGFVTYADMSLQRLLSGCPNLEALSVEHRSEDSPMDVTVVLPSLQRLHMSHNKTRGTYVLNVPSLKYLKCSGMSSNNLLQIKNMPELVTAHVIFCGATHKFLKALTSVRRLKLWITRPEVMNTSGMIFNQLVHLDLYLFREGCFSNIVSFSDNVVDLLNMSMVFRNLVGAADSVTLAEKSQLVGSRRVLFQSVYCTVLRLLSG
ncbi:hypothetical protein Bca101_079338 [Brassica carinata]